MCGFTGITFNKSKDLYSSYHKRFNNAYQYIKTRGPDDKGIWVDKNSYFLHARLSILDIKKIASQPMEFGENVICYNGEIYNFQDVRNTLISKGYTFKTNGDTEVILKSWTEWGKSMLSKLDGMFSISIWNKKEKTLFLARDRFGKKPLVYTLGSDYIAFSSDIRSLEKIADSGGINHSSIESLFRFRFIREPMTIYKNFKKLPPGSFLLFSRHGTEIKKWYKLTYNKEFYFEKKQAKLHTKNLVIKAIEKRLVSDVPLGLFLSSGIDSGIILSSLANLDKKIPCFTVGFSESKNYYDESKEASKIANYFGAKHEKIILNPDKILKEIDNILVASDEPFADSSSIPMFIISKLASNHLKVALTGDGGDETFGGYRKYISYKWSFIINLIPHYFRSSVGNVLSDSKKNGLTNFARKLRRILINSSKDDNTMQLNFLDQLSEHEYTLLFGKKKKSKNEFLFSKNSYYSDRINSLLVKDFDFSLLGDMLVKIDRYSMANSLEIRSPFLDKDLVEYTFNIPGSYKVGYFSGKLFIKDVFSSDIPKWYSKIPKKGFEVPLENWLKKELKYLVEESTKKKVIESLSFKNSNIIDTWKKDFFNGKKDNSWKLWTLICYSRWATENKLV